MNTEKLFSIQDTLDRHYATAYHLQHENLFEKKIVALLASVGSLANQSACYYYLDSIEKAPTAEILEEYVKGLSYLLSVGSDFDFQHIMFNNNRIHISEKDMNKQLLNVLEAICLFKVRKSIEMYNVLFFHYLHLGDNLGLIRDDIEEVYIQTSHKYLTNMQ